MDQWLLRTVVAPLRRMVRSPKRPTNLAVLALVLIASLWLLRTTHQLYFSGRSRGSYLRARGSRELVHVCLCSDDTDLRPAAAAINSAWMGASDPSRIVFHYITSPQLATLARDLFAQHFPAINIEVHHDAVLQTHIKSTISFRESSKARKILASPFNFAPFYLHKYLRRSSGKEQTIKRAIYIDTDTLILGDVGELADLDMQGHACAAVSYCLQRFKDYLNFPMIEELGYHNINPEQCIANRGVIMVDMDRWIETNLTGKIEQWMVNYRIARDDLWWGGMSQPPWLLAMNGDYLELSGDWNCNSLGRETMSPFESSQMRKTGFDKLAMKTLGVAIVEFGITLPYVVTCSETGKLLHYNGAMKPWAPERWPADKLWPICAFPPHFPNQKQKWSWTRTVKVFCQEQQFVACNDLWNYYISDTASHAMKTASDELREEEAELERQRQAQLEAEEKWKREVKEREERLRDEQEAEAKARARAEQEKRLREEEERSARAAAREGEGQGEVEEDEEEAARAPKEASPEEEAEARDEEEGGVADVARASAEKTLEEMMARPAHSRDGAGRPGPGPGAAYVAGPGPGAAYVADPEAADDEAKAGEEAETESLMGAQGGEDDARRRSEDDAKGEEPREAEQARPPARARARAPESAHDAPKRGKAGGAGVEDDSDDGE